ncbi:hypothetical protein pdam_00007529 [Pocillopora damicornis]|uniref:Uncharacterized protein n=1 Tax=Pocillopora damicornis TaxID=46731 RepID=A0A3M6TGI5_POCDA|nr:hypothetical protein pdam_00007529 [Pocillopora damicornis]
MRKDVTHFVTNHGQTRQTDQRDEAQPHHGKASDREQEKFPLILLDILPENPSDLLHLHCVRHSVKQNTQITKSRQDLKKIVKKPAQQKQVVHKNAIYWCFWRTMRLLYISLYTNYKNLMLDHERNFYLINWSIFIAYLLDNDYLLIWYQILQTNIMIIVWQTVRRITSEILGAKVYAILTDLEVFGLTVVDLKTNREKNKSIDHLLIPLSEERQVKQDF